MPPICSVGGSHEGCRWRRWILVNNAGMTLPARCPIAARSGGCDGDRSLRFVDVVIWGLEIGAGHWRTFAVDHVSSALRCHFPGISTRFCYTAVTQTSNAQEAKSKQLVVSRFNSRRCERQDLNLHAFRLWILSPARLPIPPLSHSLTANSSVDSGCSDTGDRRKLPYPPAAAIGFARSAATCVKGLFAVVNRSCSCRIIAWMARPVTPAAAGTGQKLPCEWLFPRFYPLRAQDNGHSGTGPQKKLSSQERLFARQSGIA